MARNRGVKLLGEATDIGPLLRRPAAEGRPRGELTELFGCSERTVRRVVADRVDEKAIQAVSSTP